MIRSLRYRLLLSASLCGMAVLGMLGFSVYAAMQHFLIREFDASLRSDAHLLITMLELPDGKVDLNFSRHQLPDYVQEGDHARFFQVWRNDGSTLEKSPTLKEGEMSQIPLTSGETAVEMALPNGRMGRAVSVNFIRIRRNEDKALIPSRTVNILAAAEPVDVNHTLSLLRWMLTILGLLAVLIMCVTMLQVVARGVRPVKRLANQIESMHETDLSRRLPRDDVPTELTPIVDKLNGLLGRLDGAFAREKSFTADVAHELRTPLTGLRMTLEVCRSRSREPAAYEAALDECRGITDRMESMVESLLLLARSESGQVAIARQEVDLCRLVAQAWSTVQYRADRLNLSVSCDLPRDHEDPHPPQGSVDLHVETDAEKLAIVLRNVMDNAVSYVNPGGQVRILARRDGNSAIIEVANTGSQVSEADAARLFERFWRGDVSRSDANIHCGLGLSLCHRLMTLLRGGITVETAKGGDFIVRLSIPAQPKSASGPSPVGASAPSAARA